MSSAMVPALELGRDAVKRHAWTEAMEAFAAADRADALAAEDLELMGEAAWWAAKSDEAADALERAFARYVEAGRSIEAAGVALHLAYQAFRRLAPSVGGGWVARAEQLLEGVPASPMHAWLNLFYAIAALLGNNAVEGLALADRAIAVARERGNFDVLFMATSLKGYAQLHQGNMEDGLRLIDEAAAAATSGQLDLRISSDIYCNTIAACRNIGDLKRAGQWADEGERWMRRQGVGGYPGICRIHRAELKMLRGRWQEAELEARQACEELQRFGLHDALGFGHYQIGEIRLRMGDLQGAADEFERAYELGHDAQPGLALLQLARGEVAEASRSIERALAATQPGDGATDRATRARLLPAMVDIAIARGDLQRVDALLGGGEASVPTAVSAQQATKTFMFTDIVTSTDLVGLVGDSAWGELLAWHDRELRSSFASHRGQEVNSTGDGFFVAFDQPADAIECAVDIQRRLARHRREQGFAPLVRIGLHSAEATRHGRDYRGQGVHVAARIGAAASSEEILVSSDVLGQAPQTRFKVSEPRVLTLKGVREPIEVRVVDWR